MTAGAECAVCCGLRVLRVLGVFNADDVCSTPMPRDEAMTANVLQIGPNVTPNGHDVPISDWLRCLIWTPGWADVATTSALLFM